MRPGIVTLLGLMTACGVIYITLLAVGRRANRSATTSQSVLQSEAAGFLIFALVYGIAAGLHFQFGSPKVREVERQVLFGAGLAVVCHLLVMLFRLHALRKLKADQPNKAPEPTPTSVMPRAIERDSK